MKITTSYSVYIKKQLVAKRGRRGVLNVTAERPVNGRLVRQTSALCLDALWMCVDIFLKEWGYLSSLPTEKKPGSSTDTEARTD